MSGKLLLVDGHSILNRAFYGLPDLTNSRGLHTNAVYGFLNILFKNLETEKPAYLAVAFDVHAPTFRHRMYADYKGTRKPMPSELTEQVPVMKEVLRAMNVLMVEKPGLEADDILGTMARQAERDGLDVTVLTGDRDLLQVATDRIKIRIPKTKGYGRSEEEDYFAKDVAEKYHVTPTQFIDVKALMGDASDNIPGVPKIGEKTATELIVQFGGLENLYCHLDDVRKEGVRRTLSEHEDLARLSKKLATILLDADLPSSYRDAQVKDWHTKEAYLAFTELGFKKLLADFPLSDGEGGSESGRVPIRIEGRQEADALFARLAGKDRVGFATLTQALRDRLTEYPDAHLGFCDDKPGMFVLSLSADGESYCLCADERLTREYLAERLADLSRETRLCAFDCKSQYWLLDIGCLQDCTRLFDILIAAYLLNPLKSDYQPEDIAHEYLAYPMRSGAQVLGKRSLAQAAQEEPDAFWAYAADLSYVPWAAEPILRAKLADAGMEKLFDRIEMPLSYVLYSMEREGIRVLPRALRAYSDELSERIEQLEGQIYKAAGEIFNLNSPKQLGEILFEKLRLPGGKKTKTGYSTAADVLEKLAPEYPIVADVLEYRGLAKLKSTYADGLAAFIGPDNRIHTTFHQTITATGRISSTDPNLQNIPMRSDLGRQIRKAFVPRDGSLFVDADYSQIELRVLASLSGDEQLIDAYRMDADIHRITASQVFHVPLEEVSDQQRRNAKAVNFGIVYGISSFGLSQGLSIGRKEAAEYIEQYFSTYPGVKKFLDHMVENAKKNGYSVTLFGRRRPIPELSSSNFMQRSFGERVAMNSPIQGTAADIIKIAMLRVYDALQKRGLKSKLILQIHDELLIEATVDEAETIAQILQQEMRAAADLAVQLEVDVHTGRDWYEAK